MRVFRKAKSERQQRKEATEMGLAFRRLEAATPPGRLTCCHIELPDDSRGDLVVIREAELDRLLAIAERAALGAAVLAGLRGRSAEAA